MGRIGGGGRGCRRRSDGNGDEESDRCDKYEVRGMGVSSCDARSRLRSRVISPRSRDRKRSRGTSASRASTTRSWSRLLSGVVSILRGSRLRGERSGRSGGGGGRNNNNDDDDNDDDGNIGDDGEDGDDGGVGRRGSGNCNGIVGSAYSGIRRGGKGSIPIPAALAYFPRCRRCRPHSCPYRHSRQPPRQEKEEEEGQ